MNTTEPASTTPATAISVQRITLSLITMLIPAKNSTSVSNVTDSSKSSPRRQHVDEQALVERADGVGAWS